MLIDRNLIWELDPASSITPQLTRILRERIIRNDLKPGDRISESELARAYDVSRQPIREAFIKLADQGLVEVRPQRGTFITKINYLAVLDARFLREAIEADIAKILAANPDPAVIADLRQQLALQEGIDHSDRDAFTRLDELFHRTLAEAAGKASAWKQIDGLKSQMDRVRYLSLGKIPTKALVQQHTDIVNRIESGDVVEANRAVRLHLRGVLNDLPKIVRANRDSFNLPDGDIPPPVNAPIQGGDEQ